MFLLSSSAGMAAAGAAGSGCVQSTEDPGIFGCTSAWATAVGTGDPLAGVWSDSKTCAGSCGRCGEPTMMKS